MRIRRKDRDRASAATASATTSAGAAMDSAGATPGRTEDAAAAGPVYSPAFPGIQPQFDLFAGEWTSAVPTPGEPTTTGPRADLFDDPRLHWLLAHTGPLEGRRVLELGPLEGGHTAMLERAGAQVLAIEANERAFLRCLVVKNALGLRSTFRLGDFVAYLREASEHFDLIHASGVLYHMADPPELLELLARHGDQVFLWTHYYDADVIAERPDVASRFSGVDEVERGGQRFRVHRYEYRSGRGDAQFCGGPLQHAQWMERAEILSGLAAFGLTEQTVAFDEPQGPHGPAFAVLARRPGAGPG